MYSTVSQVVHGMDIIVAYPDKNGIESRHGLEDLGYYDPNVQLEFADSLPEAKVVLRDSVKLFKSVC